MKLKELLSYNDIVIQCHDNPDADAIASGWALYSYFKSKDKKVRFVYSGKFPISKSNLVIMKDSFNIPVEYVKSIEKPELLLTADCQYGEGNVTGLEGDTVAVIDHHQISGPLPELSEVRSNIGSCSTVVWKMLKDEGFDVNADENLATALYYGLMTDTNSFTEISHPFDRDMRDELNFKNSDIRLFRNSNLSLEELKIAGTALERSEYNPDYKFGIVEAQPCDPNILGVISDMLLEVHKVDTCLVYSVLEFGVKLSVRSCVKEVKASELAEYISDKVGSGGGHLEKAGGFIKMDLLKAAGVETTPEGIKKFLFGRMEEYFKTTEIIYAGDYMPDKDFMKLYAKKELLLGYIDPVEMGLCNTTVTIRTIEGDIDVEMTDDMYIMIGIDGEVYPRDKAKFEKDCVYCDEPYVFPGEYEPSIKDTKTGKKISVMQYVHACKSIGTSQIYAQRLDRRLKIFTRWDDEKYYLGKPGDYMAARVDDLTDVYIIADHIFALTYDEVK